MDNVCGCINREKVMEVNIVDGLKTELCTLQVVGAHCAARLSVKSFYEKLVHRLTLIKNPPLDDSTRRHWSSITSIVNCKNLTTAVTHRRDSLLQLNRDCNVLKSLTNVINNFIDQMIWFAYQNF